MVRVCSAASINLSKAFIAIGASDKTRLAWRTGSYRPVHGEDFTGALVVVGDLTANGVGTGL